jgi:hypothetical protein
MFVPLTLLTIWIVIAVQAMSWSESPGEVSRVGMAFDCGTPTLESPPETKAVINIEPDTYAAVCFMTKIHCH